MQFEHCERMKIEGIVSKRIDRAYVSGPSRSWLKIKCAAWRRDNQRRHKLFEGPKKPPALTEHETALERKRVELGPSAGVIGKARIARWSFCRLEGAGTGAAAGDRGV